jgi:photosystem II stability/assembly factor-like uncharacterized protein
MKNKFILAVLVAITFTACKKKSKSEDTPPPADQAPSVSTLSPSFVIDTAGRVGGNVTSGGSSALTEVGVCWDTLPSPTSAKSHFNSAAAVGTFTTQLNNLKTNKTYHVRAYATNAVGTTYGDEITFKTLGQWTAVSQSSFANVMYTDNNDLYAVQYNGIIESTDNASTWHQFFSSSPQQAFIKKSNVAFSSGFFSGTNRTTDGGATWTGVNGTPSYMNCFAINGSTVYAGGNGMALSTNYGNSWVPCVSIGSATVNAIYVRDSLVFAGTSSTGVFVNNYYGLTTFTAVNSGITDFNITSMVYKSGYLFVGTGGGSIFKSSNNGSSWTSAGTVSGLGKLAVAGSRIYASSGNGVYFTDDDGGTWMQYNKGLVTASDKSVISITANANGVFIFSNSNWFYRILF